MAVKLLFVVTEDWYFVSHRLQLAKVAKRRGYEVSIATREGEYADLIRSAGIRLIPFEISRRGGNPFSEIFSLVRLYRRERPDLIHHVAIKPVVYGSIAAKFAGVQSQINAISGLGWVYTDSNTLARMIKRVFEYAIRNFINQERSFTVVQNSEDFRVLEGLGVPIENLRLIRGAGVDTDIFCPSEKSESPPVVMLAARMLWTKGVGEFVLAAEKLVRRGIDARFILVGEPDLSNPDSICVATLQQWHEDGFIEWLGRRSDMPDLWRRASIACLPSYYREGLPKSLLEAASCGLPIITTDSPGCREVIINESEGIFVAPRDVDGLADAIERLICDPDLRNAMGAKARQRATKLFDEDEIISATLSVYKDAIS